MCFSHFHKIRGPFSDFYSNALVFSWLLLLCIEHFKGKYKRKNTVVLLELLIRYWLVIDDTGKNLSIILIKFQKNVIFHGSFDMVGIRMVPRSFSNLPMLLHGRFLPVNEVPATKTM